MAVIIETSRLRLRTWRRADARLFNKHCNTLAVMRWLGGVQSRDELLEDVDYFIESQREDGHTFWVMERKADHEFLGFCGLVLVPDEDSTVQDELEIGWRLREDAWGDGYATEAAIASANFAFSKLQAPRIVSRTAVRNYASQRVMKRLGMRRVRALDYEPTDKSGRLLVFELQAEAWRQLTRRAA